MNIAFAILAAFGQTQAHPLANIKLQDGSTLCVSVTQASLVVATPYGELKIPTKDIRSIELGSHFAEDFTATLRDLGDSYPKTRATASAKALAAGTAAFPFLMRATNADDVELKTRAASLVRALQGKYPAGRLKHDPDDVIAAGGSIIKGKIAGTTIEANSAHLGPLSLKLSDLLEIRFRSVAVKSFDLDAAREDWQDTGLTVDKSSRLVVEASGQVDLWPQQPGQYVVSPKGWTGPGKGSQYPAAALVARVEGKAFLVGEAFAGSPPESGRLYLQIVGSPWSNPSAGIYKVKVSVE